MSLKDPSTLAFESPRTRRQVISSYWALILLAVPLWWHTTSIERLPLPTARVATALEAPPPRFPVDVYVSGISHKSMESLESELNSCESIDVKVQPTTSNVVDQFGRYTVALGASESSIRGRSISLLDRA